MKLSIIVPVLNQHELTTTCLDMTVNNLSGKEDVELIVLDNGSDIGFDYKTEKVKGRTIYYLKSIGVYPTFWEGLKHSTGDVLAFFHSDLVISEKNWDQRVLDTFRKDDKLGLVGFIGSNEIDASGGRGLGTTSNFQGGTVRNATKEWKGSSAYIHGKVNSGFSNAVVVDGCSMIFRRSVLEQIPQRTNFPPHHFYDRLLSCEVLEKGYTIGVLGIACDHISGQTVNQEQNYHTLAEEWSRKNISPFNWIAASEESQFNWDATIYKEAERQWLSEYRDQKHFIPRKTYNGII